MSQIIENPDGTLSVVKYIDDDTAVDVTDVSDPDVIDSIDSTVSGDDVTFDVDSSSDSVIMSVDEFLSLYNDDTVPDDTVPDDTVPDDTVSENDVLLVDDSSLYATYDTASYTFSPQTWQVNIADKRPIGYHYIMTRSTSSPYTYYLVLGRDIALSGSTYTFSDCDYYYSGGSNNSYTYGVEEYKSGYFDGSSVIVYSDLYFDYLGGRVLSYDSYFIIFLIPVLIWFLFKFVFVKRSVS